MKNSFDKCYANADLVKFVMEKIRLNIPLEEITEILEPAAGDGAFINPIKILSKELNIPCSFYDLEPDHPEILQHDFLKSLSYLKPYTYWKKGRLIITGPPYSGRLWYSFAKRASEIADYVVFISPISVYNLNHPVPTLELIAQYDLGFLNFRGNENRGDSDKKVNTCVMIYKRVIYQTDHIKEELKKDFDIVSMNRCSLSDKDYNYYISRFGYNTGEISNNKYAFSSSIGIKVKNESLRSNVEKFLINFKDNHLDEIDNNSVTISKRRVINMPNFRNWFKEEVYK